MASSPSTSSSEPAISVQSVKKEFTLGAIGSSTLREQLSESVKNLLGKKSGAKPDATEFIALQDISFEVQPGEVVGIIGKNGAGKSTLLKILSRITPPSEGQIEINGRLSSLLEVGTGFHPELTGRENIYLNGAILGMKKSEISKQFDNIVEFAGIHRFIDTPVKRYSSGMYVRLAFAVAAHLQPEILIIDEVLAVGDYEFQKKCLGKMGEMAGSGRTVIFVSHNMGAVAELCNRVIVLHEGKMVMDSKDVKSSITTYIEQFRVNQPFTASLDIENKTDSPCLFTRIDAIDKSSNSTSEFDLTETIKLVFEYELKEELRGLRIGLIVIKNGVQDLFYSFDNEDENYREITPPGKHTVTYEIPALLLKEGRYTLTLTLGSSGICYQKLEKCFDFEVVNHYTNTENKGYKKERNGLIVAPGTWNRND